MDEVRLRNVTYAELSALQHEVAISEGTSFESPEFLVIRYSGSYRDGSAGKEDALYIVAAAVAAQKAWWSPSTILDFQHLEYKWGDEMEWVIAIAWDPGSRLHEPLAVVVGDECRDALQSLLEEEYDDYCVETLEDAYAMCRRKAQENEQRRKEIRDGA